MQASEKPVQLQTLPPTTFSLPAPTPEKCYIYPTMSDSFSDPSGDPFALPEIELPARAGVPQPRAMPYLDGLNEAQRAAVLAVEGPVFVLAGAGTGKTRVLTTRLAHILHQGLARPWEVMAVTFTNKAAREMKGRIERLVGMPVERLWLGTFHALGARILRRHAELVGLKPNFTILDADDQLRLLKQLLEAEEIDDKRWPARMVLAVIQRWKDRGLTPERVPGGEGGEMAEGRVLELYALYQERLRTLNAADFGDLLLHCLTLFTKHAEVIKEYQERLKYILVDEYQDTNVAQYLWLRLLAQRHKNICCVGDDDQSIYSWRGAEVGNILRFEKDFPGARIIRLEQNYRSSGHILAAASDLIAHNQGRLGKTLWTEGEPGRPISVRGLWDGEAEARVVADEIEALQRAGRPLGEIAILVRAGFQTREFEERFLTLGLPYKVIGGLRFYERQEIRDAIAYLRVIQQPDDDLAFERIVNTPRRGIGASTLQATHRLARAEGGSLTAAARRLIETDELKPRARSALAGLMADFERWRAMAQALGHVELAETVLDESGYTAMWQSRQIGGCARPAREPQGAGARTRGVREPRGLPRPRQPGDGERGGERARPGQSDDAPLGQGPRVRRRLPARLGGGALPAPARARRGRGGGPRGGAPARLCRAHARAQPRLYLVRRQPAYP